MKNCCAVHNCINYYGTNDGKWAFFPFPSDKNIKEYWIKKLQIKSVPEDGLVCSVNVHGTVVRCNIKMFITFSTFAGTFLTK